MATPLEIVKEYNQYTQPASIADTFKPPDLVDGFLWAFFFNMCTLATIVSIFMMIRKPLERVYSAKILSKLRYDEYDGKYYVNLNSQKRPSSYYDRKPPPSQEFSASWEWLRFLYRHSDEQVFNDLGLDETVMTKLLVFAMEIFSVILVLNIPLYAYFAIDSETHFEWNHSMADIEHGSWILWVYLCFVWIKSFVCMYFLWKHTKSFVNFRQRYLVNGIESVGPFASDEVGVADREMVCVHKRSIYVDHIPRGKRTEERIRELFERGIWKGRVRSVYVKRRVEDRSDHERKVSTVKARMETVDTDSGTEPPRREKSKAIKRSAASAAPARDIDKQHPASGVASSFFTTTLHGERVSWRDLYDEYVSWESLPKGINSSKIDDDGDTGSRRRQGGGGFGELFSNRLRVPKHSSPLADAIVVFDDAYTANVAAQMSFTVDSGLRTRLAPSPWNVYESNVGYHGWAGFDARFFCTLLFYIALILFWAVPVSLVASLTSIDSLEEHWDWVHDIRNHPWLFDLVQTYLPTVGLYLFMTLLPYILQYFSRFEGLKTKSEMDEALMYRYFIFLLLNILLVTSLSGGIFAILYSVSYEGGLSDIPELLGKSLPNMYLFFVSYVMLQAMTILPMDLLRIPSLLSMCWSRVTTDGTREAGMKSKETESAVSADDAAYAALHRGHGSGEKMANHLLVFCISLVYSSFTPLMLPFSLFYFGFGLMLHRQQAYYVYARAFESGGAMWLYVIHCVVAGLFVYILAIMGMIILLDGLMQAFLLTPLLFVVSGFHYYLRSSYGNLMEYMALSSTFDYRFVSDRSRRVEAAAPASINAAISSTKKTADDSSERTPLLDAYDDDEVISDAERGDRAAVRDRYVAFRAYASEFGGTCGSISGLHDDGTNASASSKKD